MGTAEQGRIRDVVEVVAAIALVGLTGYVVKLAVDDRESPDVVLAVAGAACLAGLVGMAMWWFERRAARSAAAELRGIEGRRRAEVDEIRERAERKQEELEGRLRDRQQAIDRERDLRVRVERARSAEHEWNRELRSQVVRLHRDRGHLAAMDDMRQLVLRMA